MSREASNVQPSHPQTPSTSPAIIESQQGNEAAATVIEDSNNNTSLIDREQSSDGTTTDVNSSQLSPSIREIHKNSWLKRMPCVDRWSGRFPKVT